MKARIFSFIIGLTILIGTPLTALSLIDSYTSPIVQKTEVETTLKTTSLINVDFPIQEGNLRLLKITFRDLRSNNHSSSKFLNDLSCHSEFDHYKNIYGQTFQTKSNFFNADHVPLFIRLRSIVI